MNIKVGQVLKLKSRDGYQKVLAVLGENALLSKTSDFDKAFDVAAAWVTFKEIEEHFELPKEKWKPANGHSYWIIYNFIEVIKTNNDNTSSDRERIEAGNCFETEQKALAALEKIKKILAE